MKLRTVLRHIRYASATSVLEAMIAFALFLLVIMVVSNLWLSVQTRNVMRQEKYIQGVEQRNLEYFEAEER